MIYVTGKTPAGALLIGGLFRLKDEAGFPIETAYETIREKKWLPDWAEALADAGSQSIEKFDSLATELGYLLGEPERDQIISKFKGWGATLKQEGKDFGQICREMLAIKHERET